MTKMKIFYNKYLLSVILLLLVINASHAGVGSEQILESMLNSYQSMYFYEDNGVVLQATPGNDYDSVKNFRTNYNHPSQLLFEWGTTKPTNLSKYLGGKVTLLDGVVKYTDIDGNETIKNSIYSALSRPVGHTSGASFEVPRYLIRQCEDDLFGSVAEFKLLPDEVCQGRDCFVVEIFYKHGTVKKLWIDKQYYVLRMIKYTGSFDVSVIKYENIEFSKINQKKHTVRLNQIQINKIRLD